MILHIQRGADKKMAQNIRIRDFVVRLAAPNAPGSSTLLARPLANLSMK
jgi:hypothetical protein